MTLISYLVTDKLGNKTRVKTLPQAEAIIHESGGSYITEYETVITACEAHCRRGYRAPGTQC